MMEQGVDQGVRRFPAPGCTTNPGLVRHEQVLRLRKESRAEFPPLSRHSCGGGTVSLTTSPLWTFTYREDALWFSPAGTSPHGSVVAGASGKTGGGANARVAVRRNPARDC